MLELLLLGTVLLILAAPPVAAGVDQLLGLSKPALEVVVTGEPAAAESRWAGRRPAELDPKST